MQRIASRSDIISLPTILRAPKPKAAVTEGLVRLLTPRLKALKIVWNPTAFRGGLHNPALPAWLPAKLESLITLAEASGWRVSRRLRGELDTTIEDIESFNPPFVAALKRASRDIRAGRFTTMGDLERKYDIGR